MLKVSHVFNMSCCTGNSGNSVILSPNTGDVFSIALGEYLGCCAYSYTCNAWLYNALVTKFGSTVLSLGSTVAIDCKAVVYSDFDEVFWLSDTSFVEMNDSFSVFYNYTR